jgi:CzcA family heavy metal efflux pump
MIRWIVGSSLKFRLLVLGLAATLIVVGTVQLRSMPVDVLPEFAPPSVEVQAEALGLSAAEVESLVTVNLEELLNGTPWLDSIRSTSVPGLSSIVLTFKPGTDVTRARQLVAERLTLAYALPNVSQPPVILQPKSATSRVLMVGLSSRTVSPIQMSVLARWTIRPALLAVPGVANVTIWGQRERQLQVLVDPKQLAADHVSLDQIVRTAGNAMWVSPLTYLEASRPGSGGWIDTPQQRLEVRHVFPIRGPGGLAKVTVEDGTRQLGNVAKVIEDHQPLIGDAILQNGSGLLLVVEKFPGSNTLEVTRGVEDTLDRLQPGLAGITIDSSVFRPATFIRTSINNLAVALLIGLLLVALALVAVFFNWRAALISLVAIPLALVSALLVVNARGTTMNTMVLAGLVIALGVVVDDAVIDVENIMRRLRSRSAEDRDRSTAAVILEASLEMRRVIVYGTLISVLPLLVVFFMSGVSGALFRPLAVTYTLALLASLAVALTATPALSAVLLSKSGVGRHESPFLRWLRRAHAAALSRIVRRPCPALVASAVTMAAGIAVVPFLGQSLLPSFNDPNLVVRWDGPPGTSRPEMKRITARAMQELRSIPGVRNAAGEIGRAVLGDQIVDINSAALFVNIDRAEDYQSTLAEVRRTIDGYPGIVRDVQTYERQTVRRVLSGSSEPIVVRVFGPRFDVLQSTAREVRHALSGIDGVGHLNMEQQVQQPHVQIEVNLGKARRYGLKPGDVRRAAATLLASLEVGSLFEQQKVFQVVVWTKPQTRHGLTDISRLLIDTPRGDHVHLGDVADVRVAPTPNLIKREAVSRRIDIGLEVRGRDLGSVSHDVHERLASVNFPLEYHAEVVGEFAERQANDRRMIGAGIAAAIGIFLLLQALFQSWRLASLSFVTLPFALVGGALAAFVAGDAISLGSLVGFLAVLGIAARNGIFLIKHYQHLQQHEGLPLGPELILRGARERFAPILLTALTVGLALTPLVVSGATAGQEIAQPIAVIVLGGLVTSTLLNLFVVPVLYLRIGPRERSETHGTASAA